jgi:hypothetical protein
MIRLRAVVPAAVAALRAVALAACGGGGEPAAKQGPPGSPDNPIPSGAVDQGTDPDAPGKPANGFEDIVAQQQAEPEQRQSPCALVTKAQAQAILGVRLMDPLEAPQGPTCIYRDRGGDAFVTVAVQGQRFSRLRGDLERAQRVAVGDRDAYCGVHGAPTLYLPLERDRVLSVTGQCDVATRFARRAASRLGI